MKLKQQEEQNFEVRIQDVLAQLKKVKKSGSGYTALCPVHDDKRSSLSVSEAPDGKLLMHCHACKAPFDEMLRALGLWQETSVEASKIESAYDYTDEEGELLYQVLRLKPKRFAQRRPDGSGGWIYNLNGVQRTIYRLPYIVETTQPVIIVEGEKDADLLVSLGYNATTNSGGAGKWQKEFNKYFKGLDVIIIPDNDEAGFNHAEEVSKHIYFAASSVKIVHLDGLKDKEDLSDWLAKHETGDLDVLIDSVEPLEYTEEDIQLNLTEPHDANAEFGIIGAVLKDNKHIAKIVESDVAKDFFIAKNRHVIQAMVDAFNEHENIDRITLSNRLNRSKKLKELNVLEYLKSIEENTPDNLNVDNWIHIVQSKSDFRKYVKIGKKLSTTVYTESEDVGKLGDSLTEDIFNIRRNDKKDGFSSIGETSYKVFHSARNLEQGEITGLATGFKVLDEITSGLQRTDLIIIAARPSMGKTGLAVNIATNVALQGGKVAFFSLEMSKEQLGQRIIAAEARINSQSFRNGNLDESDWVRMANVLPQLENAPLFIDDTAGITVNQLRVKARRLAAEQKRLDLIVVDYLQLMTGKGHEGRVQEVSQISRELKALAKEMDVPVIALSQLSRAPEARNPPKPMMSDLRESGSIEQDADVVAFIYREEYYQRDNKDVKGLSEIIFSKHRNGPTGSIMMGYIDKFTKFMDLIEV